MVTAIRRTPGGMVDVLVAVTFARVALVETTAFLKYAAFLRFSLVHVLVVNGRVVPHNGLLSFRDMQLQVRLRGNDNCLRCCGGGDGDRMGC